MRSRFFFALTSLWFLFSIYGNAFSEPNADHINQLVKQCIACHSADVLYGDKFKYKAPKLVGQNAMYIVNSLKAYIEGQRKDDLYHSEAGKLSASEVEEIANYFMGNAKPDLASQTQPDSGARSNSSNRDENMSYNDKAYDAKKVVCAACHSRGGNHPIQPDYPILAGQYRDYLIHALRSYWTGQRQHPLMEQQVNILQLTELDMQRMAKHYATENGLTAVPD